MLPLSLMDNDIHISAQRLRQVREEYHFTQQAFAERLGIGSTTADIERGRTKLSGKAVAELLKQLGINPLWLFGESDEQYLSLSKGDVSPKVITLNSESDENILLVNIKASAGYAHNLQEPEWYDELPTFDLPLPQFRNATYRGFQVEGDSMLPALLPGEWVIARAEEGSEHTKDNELYVVVLADSVLVKRLVVDHETNKLQLISLNPAYPLVTAKLEEVQELWRVQGKIAFDLSLAQTSQDLLSLRQEMQQGFSSLREEMEKLKDG